MTHLFIIDINLNYNIILYLFIYFIFFVLMLRMKKKKKIVEDFLCVNFVLVVNVFLDLSWDI